MNIVTFTKLSTCCKDSISFTAKYLATVIAVFVTHHTVS